LAVLKNPDSICTHLLRKLDTECKLYLPCLATTVAIRRGTSTRWMVFSIGYSTAVAWGMAFVVYQDGRLLDFS
jgi:Fe2+ transport system protein B